MKFVQRSPQPLALSSKGRPTFVRQQHKEYSRKSQKLSNPPTTKVASPPKQPKNSETGKTVSVKASSKYQEVCYKEMRFS